MSNRSKKNKQKSQPVTPDAILAVVRTLESHTSDPEDALMVLAATAHSLMTSLDVHIIESRTPDGLGITLTRTDEENKQKAGRQHLH
ncbi:hypothetical protein CI424_21980 [Salmonella enterica subsp. enterica serovar Enteritidis]|nr:hypothetical protein [Salmonella enterica subsp. enterica serovar Newport]EDK5263821.1 hypothetical protein [Salmonella enterica subsp. enterica serovar Enteritidis]EDQ2394092.1 hypothetical protein [Salmonella enterica subsp. enterica]EEA1387067.1 hypothetical protein [Salmonella enterica]EEL2954094.1 hypothetical protein [Salmonella enterica]